LVSLQCQYGKIAAPSGDGAVRVHDPTENLLARYRRRIEGDRLFISDVARLEDRGHL